jgi:hypothetical protein
MARAAIYYRVSTVDQSVDGQIAELREYAEKRGFEIAGEYVDRCSGAARQRPELDRMMGDVLSVGPMSFSYGLLIALPVQPLILFLHSRSSRASVWTSSPISSKSTRPPQPAS